MHRTVFLEHHNENFAEVIFRTVNAAHAVPGVAAPSKNQAAVLAGLRWISRIEILKARRVIRADAASVIQNDSLTTPIRMPVSLGVQVENLGADLAFRIAVGGYLSPVGGEVPVKAETHFLYL